MSAYRGCLVAALFIGVRAVSGTDVPDQAAGGPISFYRQVQPILQANCQGCHQPAKAGGEYVMTSVESLLRGGESGVAAITAGQPEESYLVELITPHEGRAEMPQGQPPLAAGEIELIRAWIEQGAQDDTPQNARSRYDAEHPPAYARPAVIPSLDYSPDGTLLAIAGFHEALLFSADGSERVARLIGLSERVESVRFSPDGTHLAVVGGLPCRMGEVQIWDVAEKTLLLSAPATFDTLYGASWSPDGKLVAFGAADNSVRAVETETGKQVVYMAAHEDWVRGTVFSGDGQSIFSASRDMTVKMTDVATQRFVGNVTTHTPGVLRGGMLAVVRHPQKNQLLVGSADGAPKLFEMDVKAAPASGGNPNQIREYEPLSGRVFDVRFSPDGSRAFAGASLDGVGQVRCYEIESGKVLWTAEVAESAVYALACSPDGSTLAAAGSDGHIRLIDTTSGSVRSSFLPVDVAEAGSGRDNWTAAVESAPHPAAEQSSPGPPALVSLEAHPASVALDKPTDYVQLVLSGTLADGRRVDVTRLAAWRVEGDAAQVTASGRVTPRDPGTCKIVAELNGQRVEVTIDTSRLAVDYEPDFIRDVNPVLSRLGCNQGTCHGAAKGKNGFKLSLRGYDAPFDIRALTDDLASRRVNRASPDDSLMLLKATAAVPHQGGQLFTPGSPYYQILRHWIANGARVNLAAARVARIEVLPAKPVVQQPGETQQMQVLATYADGTGRDVTREAFMESGNTEVATVDRDGVMTAVRRGEAAVLARFEGAYAAATLTVMGDRTGFVWQPPETWGRIDELVAAKWQRMRVLPSELSGDADFVRRVHLDLTGLPPTADQVREFLNDPRPTRVKRDELIDRLIGSGDYLEHWTNKWADLLQVNRKHLGAEGAALFRNWIRAELAANTPYDQLARKLLTASGSNREDPAASYFKILRDPLDTMENTTHLFLGVRFNCNKCHDHPFERWTQDQYYQTAAYFARVELTPDPAAGDKKIEGTAVEGAKPLYEIVRDKSEGEVIHERTQAVAAAQFPFECRFDEAAEATRRQELASWLTSPDNPYFARSYANRLWGYLLGTGIIEPLDDIRAGNPPTNPELLEHLTSEFIGSGFDVRHLTRLICRSRTYQLSLETNRWNEDDTLNYSHALARRLPAEVLYDAICRVTGHVSQIPGVPPGTRAAALPDSGVNLPDGFLTNLGRPARESACECERASGLELGPIMALISGPSVDSAIADPNNELAKLVDSGMSESQLVEEVFLRILNRPATTAEVDAALSVLQAVPAEHQQLTAELQDYEQRLAPAIAAQEQKRQQAIAKATAELAAYEDPVRQREAELDRQHQERLAEAEASLKAYEQQVPDLLAAWEQQVRLPAPWTVLDPSELSSTNGAQLARQDDLSVVATGDNGKSTYQFAAHVDRATITGVKLEVLTHDSLPGKGPGRAQNGNFVLSEFRVEWTPDGDPAQKTAVVLQNPQADFSQQGYDVATAIDGQKAPTNNGWATAPKTGENRTAVFETREDVGGSPGTLTFLLDQEFADGMHTIGRFRISITSAARPVLLDGLPKNITDILAVTADQRSDQQKAELLAYYRGTDAELKQREQAAAEARKPRVIDPQLQSLRDVLAEVSKPLPIDPRLAQLRHDVELSARQLQNVRLTFAQDLAWALINSPAFLFNR